MARSQKFWNMMAKRYAASPVGDEVAYQEKLAKTREYFTLDSQVLELACGTGSTAIAHAPYVGQLRAVDFSENMIAIAQDKATAAGVGNLSFTVSSIDDFDAPDASYDVVMMHNILHLLPNRDVVIAKVYALLNPGGVFVSGSVCMGEMNGLLKMLVPIANFLRLLPQLQVLRAEDIEASLAGAGFSLEHVQRMNGGKTLFAIVRK